MGALRSALGAAVALLALQVGAASGEGAAPPPGECTGRAVAAIQARYEGIADYSARFEQTTRPVSLGAAAPTRTARGRVRFAKPGRMRWDYEEPEPSLVVSDGETLWIYDPGRREAQRFPVGGRYFSGASIQFLLGEGDILREFEVESLACGEERVELELLPRRPEAFERLRVHADPRSGDLLRTEVVDLLGNVTAVSFSEIRVDEAPAAETFAFVPGAGVEVIELAPGGTP